MKANAEIFLQDLPEVLREIADLVGVPATLKLVESYGGTHLIVPSRYNPDHPLTRVVGHAASVQICQRYSGTSLYVARIKSAIKTLRDIEIASRYDGGVSVPQLAREYELSDRQIWNVLKNPNTLRAEKPRQTSLFD